MLGVPTSWKQKVEWGTSSCFTLSPQCPHTEASGHRGGRAKGQPSASTAFPATLTPQMTTPCCKVGPAPSSLPGRSQPGSQAEAPCLVTRLTEGARIQNQEHGRPSSPGVRCPSCRIPQPPLPVPQHQGAVRTPCAVKAKRDRTCESACKIQSRSVIFCRREQTPPPRTEVPAATLTDHLP